MEPRFGQDFSRVRVHIDARKVAAANGGQASIIEADDTLAAEEQSPRNDRPIRNINQTGQDCDSDHNNAIESALNGARGWRSSVSDWFRSHLERVGNRARIAGDRPDHPIRIGAAISRELNLLHRHFKIGDLISERGTNVSLALPILSENERFSVRDFQNFYNSSRIIHERFQNVDLNGLSFQCLPGCPAGGIRRTLAESPPGSSEVTIYTGCFDWRRPDINNLKNGVVLHEAFHASFSSFNHDTYSFESDYPGSSPITNADSYATIASIVSTGSTYRVQRVPEIRIII
jgi:hypothetical protein